MPTTIYDSSLITKRRMEKAQSGNFIGRIQNGVNSTTGYAPALGIYDQSIINNVKLGQMTDIKKCEGAYIIDTGCPCGANSSGSYLTTGTINNINNVNNAPIVLTFEENSTITEFTILTPFVEGVRLNILDSHFQDDAGLTSTSSLISITGTIPSGAQLVFSNSAESQAISNISIISNYSFVPTLDDDPYLVIKKKSNNTIAATYNNVQFYIILGNKILATSNEIDFINF